MKKILLVAVTFFIIITASAQLASTSWKGTLNLDQPQDAVFRFSVDTLDVVNADDGSSLETMKYTFSDSTLTIQKLFGQSECDVNTIGTYKCTVAGDQMLLNFMSDACDDRRNVIGKMELKKVN